MRRALLLSTAMLGAAAALASPLDDAARRLDGEWRGPGVVLRVDRDRAQANVDLDRPFAWERFEVKEVSESHIVFTIGGELFEAVVGADILVLTGTTFRGERVLVRAVNLRGTTTE
jgi:hypothetical protein